MKVAYNNCFGGFLLSALALTEYARLKGITLIWYRNLSPIGQASEYVRIDELPEPSIANYISLSPLTKDLGLRIDILPKEHRYYQDQDTPEFRSDPDLIQVIEKYCDSANSSFSDIAIKEIPDGVEFEITECDGNENVVPPRQVW